jgi:hypothetical protein
MPRPRRPREEYECGTYAAYQAHIKRGDRGDQIDEPCRRANRVYNNDRRHGAAERERKAKYSIVERRAFLRLAELHKVEFLDILLEEQCRPDPEEPDDEGTQT